MEPKQHINWSWTDARARGILWQVIIVLAVIATVGFLWYNLYANLVARNINTGFGFLWQETNIQVENAFFTLSSRPTYLTILINGLLNTLQVAFIGIIVATIIGVLVGVGRLSNNWLLAKICAVYVECLRNVPVLIQIVVWYSITQLFPGSVRNALNPVSHIYLSTRGIFVPTIIWNGAALFVLALFVASIIGAFIYGRKATAKQMEDGNPRPIWSVGLLIAFVPTLLAIVVLYTTGALQISIPELGGFNFRGGTSISPEFMALTLGLSIYTSAFIAEIVRAGILSVPKGQWEAAGSLGLRPSKTMSKVVLPQALRVIIPPLTSQYLNLTKNSSLAAAIGYNDIFSVARTALTSTGQAIENIAIIMAVFLIISLTISLVMNWYNKAIALKER